MPLYLRKSVKAGPFRFNLSTSGIGASVGIKGLRIGTGPRGHYISAGRKVVRYKASVRSAGERAPMHSNSLPSLSSTSDVEMIEVNSGSVVEMRDEKFAAILDDINAASAKTRLSIMLPAVGALAFGISVLYLGLSDVSWMLLASILPLSLIGKWQDTYRRAAVLHYDLVDGGEEVFKRITVAFDAMSKCAGTWRIKAGGAIHDLTTWKRNAGASLLIRRSSTTLDYKLPRVVKSNITPPAIAVGKRTIYFFPDVALVEDGNRFGAVGYADLKLSWQTSNFIETDAVPRDAEMISETWEHPNKSGGPDRRFRSNRRLPVCLYEALHLSSGSGVNELLQFSQTSVAQAFVAATGALPRQSLPAVPLPLPRA